MPCKPGVAGSIPGFSIKPLSVSLRVLPSYNKHTYHKPSRPSTGYYPWKSHKKFFFCMTPSHLLNGSDLLLGVIGERHTGYRILLVGP